MTSLPKSATGTSRAVVRLAVGDAQAVYWNDEVFAIPANQVVRARGLAAYMSRKKGTTWHQNGES
eukprot:12697207-Prorocentrum_lima.AAC.1